MAGIQAGSAVRESFTTLIAKLRAKQAVVAVVGLGFVGLPEATAIAQAGYSVIGLDVDREKVALIRRGRNPATGAAGPELKALQEAGRLYVTADASEIGRADCAVLCVPSPLTAGRDPDLTYITAAAAAVADRLADPKLVVIQSTCPPGTTRRVVLPLLERNGACVGRDFFLAYAPERIDPGNRRYDIRNTPRLVAGITERCTQCAAALYSPVIDGIKVVSSVEVAELTKIVENAFRFVNISFVNELAVLCDGMGVNVWEVIEAAASKPFGFMPHQPGPGVGGACIPVVPFHLMPGARELGVSLELIDAAGRVNAQMPQFVVDKLERLLRQQGKALHKARILVLGVTYKTDVPDMRESPALRVMELLTNRGTGVSYHDPLVGALSVAGQHLESTPLTMASLAAVDCVLLLTPHSGVDYDLVVDGAPLVFDTRNHLAGKGKPNVVCL